MQKLNQDKIFTVDVGQGDAIFINYNRKKILIDGGPDYEVDKFLSKMSFLGNCTLDVVILTHFHADHINGLNRVLEHCRISKIFYPSADIDMDVNQNRTWFNLIIGKSAVKITEIKKFNIMDLKFLLIPSLLMGNSMNNSSYAVYLEKGKFNALFMADLELAAISKIKNSILMSIKDKTVNFYKVSHHGSLTGHDINFLSKLKPKICVVSVGKDNKFGHPSSQVIQNLEDLGCEVKQTVSDSTIEVSIK